MELNKKIGGRQAEIERHLLEGDKRETFNRKDKMKTKLTSLTISNRRIGWIN